MDLPRALDVHPAFLPPGTRVGPWRVVSRRGRGAYGVVYRAVREGCEPEGFVALKLAVMERDPRYAREVEVLSRIHHPGVPRPRDQGDWVSPGGRLYPYSAVEWVDGTPLYEWAFTSHPSMAEMLRVLAQGARALEATHAAGGVHRDVRGDNMWVRGLGEHAMLTDFGTGHHKGAEGLPPWPLPPGTSAYRSPESWQFAQRYGRQRRAQYAARAADDLFALGVTAYRLVTEQYPPPTEPSLDRAQVWYVEGEELTAPIEINGRVPPELNALILRLLSVNPEVRGTARELAEALERAAQPEEAAASPRAVKVEEPWQSPAQVPGYKRWFWFALAAAAVVVPLAMKSPRPEPGPWGRAEQVQSEGLDGGLEEGGPVETGDEDGLGPATSAPR